MTEVVMPQMGESLAEGTVVRWLKHVGDAVARDEAIVEISTDKVDTEVPSPVAGVLKQTLVAEGQTVAVGAALAVIESDVEAAETATTHARSSAAESTPTMPVGPTAGSAPTAGAAPPAPSSDAGHFKTTHAPQLVSFRREPPSPARDVESRGHAPMLTTAVLETARRGGLTLDDVLAMRGSGRGGRVTRKDVERHLERRAGPEVVVATGGRERRPAPSDADVPVAYLYRPKADDRVEPMSVVRKRIADHMSWSARISPHATAFAECDMHRAAAWIAANRDAFARATASPLTYTAFIAHAVVQVLQRFPVFNASVVGESIVYKSAVNLGVAVALDETDELVVPVIHGADGLTLEGVARALDDKATRARARKLRPDDMQGGTFTLTNPGVFGGLGGTPILNQPQVGILGLGAIVKRPVVVDDTIAIRPMLWLTLTFDHRASDGMQAFKFLGALKTRLESPPAL